MNIVLFRVDERLIHGQVAHSWTVESKPNHLIVIDDEARNDPLIEMTLEMAVPSGKKFSLFNIDEAASYLLENNEKKGERIFIIVKSPRIPLELFKKGVNIPSINVGGMYYDDGRRKITKTVYLNDNDINYFKQLKENGIEAEIRTNPSDKSYNLYNYI